MKTTLRLTIAAFGLAAFNLSAATLYVSLESTNPVAAVCDVGNRRHEHSGCRGCRQGGGYGAGDEWGVCGGERDVLVWSRHGSRRIRSLGLSRVVVTNAIRLESVNGPLVTTI